MGRSCLCYSGLVHSRANAESQVPIDAQRDSSVCSTKRSGIKQRWYAEPFSEREDGRSAFGGVIEGGNSLGSGVVPGDGGSQRRSFALDPPGKAEMDAAGSSTPEGSAGGEGWKSALKPESLEGISGLKSGGE